MRRAFSRACIIFKSNISLKQYGLLILFGIIFTLWFKEPMISIIFMTPSLINFKEFRGIYATRAHTESERLADWILVATFMTLINGLIIAVIGFALYHLKGPEFFLSQETKLILESNNVNTVQAGVEAAYQYGVRSSILLLLTAVFTVYAGTRPYRIRLTRPHELTASLVRCGCTFGIIALAFMLSENKVIASLILTGVLLIGILINNNISKHQYDVI